MVGKAGELSHGYGSGGLSVTGKAGELSHGYGVDRLCCVVAANAGEEFTKKEGVSLVSYPRIMTLSLSSTVIQILSKSSEPPTSHHPNALQFPLQSPC